MQYRERLRVQNSKPLSKQEINELILQYRDGNYEAGKKVVKHNLRWLIKIISCYKVRYNVEEGDLLAYGVLGMYAAMKKFDVLSGYSFTNYSSFWIRNKINRFLYKNNIVSVPEHRRNEINVSCLTLSSIVEDKNNLMVDMGKNIRNPCMEKNIKEYIKGLPAREKFIIEMHYGFAGEGCYTLTDIAEMLGLCRERVRQVLAKLMWHMKRDKKLKAMWRES